MSVRTVEFHVGSVYRKLSVSSHSQLTRFILQPPAANACHRRDRWRGVPL